VHLVVHGHFYQPPRENPWTETVPVEPSAAPFHDWNERITVECYRPNAYARVVDDFGRVVSIVNNYAHLSFNAGPTLLSWLEGHHPEVLDRMVEADREQHSAIAQAYSHMILPLADERDARTQVRWGLADFEHRFGRRAEGMWLPETAVDDVVLAVLAEEGVRFTILAPGQAATEIDTRRTYRWRHPGDPELGVDIVFYDGPLSHDVAFGGATSSQALVQRAQLAAPEGGLVCVATDGETFGHHQHWADRALAYAFEVEAPRAGIRLATARSYLEEHPPTEEVTVSQSSWSCAHGIERWRSDCGCSTGGQPGWHQRWRAPLRAALDLLRDAGCEVFERRGPAALRDHWTARDAYIDVILGRVSRDAFERTHVTGDPVEAMTLLEAQRNAMLMYTSCGWFFNDLAGIETVQVLRYAARVIDLLQELDETPPVEEFLEVLAKAESNVPEEGNGRAVWERHVVPARVEAQRVVAHLALVDLLERDLPLAQLGGFAVQLDEHDHIDRGSISLSSGRVTLTHGRTGRRSRHVYAALHLGGLEVLGATRLFDPERDPEAVNGLRNAFVGGTRVTVLLRMIGERFGPHEFGLESALPEAPDQIVRTAATSLVGRFVDAYERLVEDNRPTFRALEAAGYPLPEELRAPAEMALRRRFLVELAALTDSWDPAAYGAALTIARDARRSGLRILTPDVQVVMEEAVVAATRRTVEHPDQGEAHEAVALLRLARELGVGLNVDAAQDIVFDAMRRDSWPALRWLAETLNIAVEQLGSPE